MADDVERKYKSRDWAKVWASVSSTGLGVGSMLVSTLAGTADLIRFPATIVVAIGAVVVTGAFTLVLARRERGPSRVATLKRELADAYLGALDRSVLNPNRGNGR